MLNAKKTTWFSPKVKVGVSRYAGLGLFCIEPLAKDEIIAVKGGHLVDKQVFNQLPKSCQMAALQINDSTYLCPVTEDEIKDSMVYINHSCNPNVGLHGDFETVAMRDILPGEELTGDYCINYTSPHFALDCSCGEPNCRGRITENDWLIPELQDKYRGYFCKYLENKISRKHIIAKRNKIAIMPLLREYPPDD